MSNKHQDILNSSGPNGTLNIGYGNFVLRRRIVAILESGSLPMKRLREKASDQSLLVDATAGRKMRSLIILDSHHVVVSALATQTLQDRIHGVREKVEVHAALLEMEAGEFVS